LPVCGVDVSAVIVQKGSAPPVAVVQATSMVATLPVPIELLPATEYVTVPAALALAEQASVLLVQWVHEKRAAAGVQLDVSVTVVPPVASAARGQRARRCSRCRSAWVDAARVGAARVVPRPSRERAPSGGTQKITGNERSPSPSGT
jgi:hypothetical protein